MPRGTTTGNLSRVAEALGPEPRRALPPAREARDRRREPPRRRSSVYLVALHLVLAAPAASPGCAAGAPPGCSPSRPGSSLSLLVGRRALPRALRAARARADGRPVPRREATSRRGCREVGQPELDALVAVYNRMIDSLREERLRAQEQHHFLEEVLAASPAGILTFDFDGRLATRQPGRRAAARAPAADLLGLRLDGAAGAALARELAALAAGRRRGPAASGQPAECAGEVEFLDRGFSADLPRARGADRGAAPLREGGLREAHPHDVPRGQQLDRRRRLAARVVPPLREPGPPRGPPGLRDRPRRRRTRA